MSVRRLACIAIVTTALVSGWTQNDAGKKEPKAIPYLKLLTRDMSCPSRKRGKTMSSLIPCPCWN